MAKPAELTQERLKSLLRYDPDTGQFTWVVKRGNLRAGSPAGGLNAAGYVQIMVDFKNHYAHRLAWLYVHGRWPEQDIDHIDGNKANNRIVNLRDVRASVNGHNRRGANSNNQSSGLIGVKRNRNRWAAAIVVDRAQHHIGTFDRPDEAAQARQDWIAANHPPAKPKQEGLFT